MVPRNSITRMDAARPFMRLAEHLTIRFALGASNQRLPGRRKHDVLRPGIAGMRGSMVIRLRPCMISSTPSPAINVLVPMEKKSRHHPFIFCFASPIVNAVVLEKKYAGTRRSFLFCQSPPTINVLVFARREVSIDQWFIARMLQTGKIRTLLHPEHFSKALHETPKEAMESRRAEVETFMSMGARLLQGDMDEVMFVAFSTLGIGVYSFFFFCRFCFLTD